MMMSDDDDAEPQVSAVENYYLLDSLKHPVCFSTLPLWHGDTDDVPECKRRLGLRGTADRINTVYKEVVAWRLVLEGKQPEIAVLAADGSGWIHLVKPKKSYEETVRTVLITAQMLHFLRRKPDEPEKNLWSHIRKVFEYFPCLLYVVLVLLLGGALLRLIKLACCSAASLMMYPQRMISGTTAC